MKSKLLERVAVIVFAAALACGLCGCSISDKEESAPKQTTAEQTTKPVVASHKLQLDITCQENLFFSRYDVSILIDGTSIGTLDHGATKTYELDLEEGSHTLTVEKEDDSAVDGSVDFEVTQESYASCTLTLNSDQVNVEDFQIISKSEKEEREKIAQEEAAAAEEAARKQEEEARKQEEAEARAAQEEAARQAQEEAAAKAAAEKANTPLTVENDTSFAEFLDSEDYEVISEFVNSHVGQVIEFDGNVAAVSPHGNFNTRFDYLIYGGNYSETSAHGPAFQFEDVNYYDLKMVDGSPDTIGVGLNLHIKARIVEYDSLAGIIKLEPVEISVR